MPSIQTLEVNESGNNNSYSSNSPSVQPWSSEIGVNYVINYLVGSGNIPGDVVFNVDIEDAAPEGVLSEYSEFHIVSSVAETSAIPAQAEWLAVSDGPQTFGDIDFDFSGAPVTISGTDNHGDVRLKFENFDFLQPGTYVEEITFATWGKGEDGVFTLVSTFTMKIILNVTTDEVISWDPGYISFTHVLGASLPSATFTMNGNNWQVNIPQNYNLVANTPGYNVIDVSAPFGAPLWQCSGSGTCEFTLTPSNHWNQQSSVGGPFYSQIEITDTNNPDAFLDVILITMFVVDPNAFTVTPQEMEFTAIMGLFEADAQVLTITVNSDVEVNAPAWLNLTDISNPNVPAVVEYSAQPISSFNIAPGVYEGIIYVTATVNGIEQTIEVAVTYSVQGMVSSPYNSTGFFFTLQQEYLSFATGATDTYFSLDLTVKTFTFYNGIMTEEILPYKIPFFEGRAKMNIGLIVDRLMDTIKVYNDQAVKQYKVALVGYVVKEIDFEGVVVREVSLDNIKFVAGRKPPRFVSNLGFLETHKYPTRVTKNGFAFINILLPLGVHDFKTFKNGAEVGSGQFVISDYNIIRHKIDFVSLTPGDVFEFKIFYNTPSGLRNIAKQFICFPEQQQSYFVSWEQNNKLLTVLEFTGAYKLQADYESITNKLHVNLVDAIRRLKVSKEYKLTLNTGWLLQTDQLTIDSLQTSKICWLLMPGSDEAVEIIPTGKSIVAVDSARALCSYDVEFTINKSHDAQGYNF